MMLELRYPLELHVVEARGVYDAEADEEDVLSSRRKIIGWCRKPSTTRQTR